MNDLQQFELLQDLRPNGSAQAVRLKWDGSKYSRTNEQVELFEFIGLNGFRGHRCYACFSADSGRWEVVGGMQERREGWLPH